MTLTSDDVDNNMSIYLDGKWKVSFDNGTFDYTFFSDAISQFPGDSLSLQMNIGLPQKNETYGIVIPSIGRNYSLYVDDKLIFTNLDSHINYIDCLRVHYFYCEQNNVTVTINTSPSFINTPLHTNIKFGKTSDTENDYIYLLFKDLVFFIFFCTAAVYYFIITINDKAKSQYISFLLICLISALRVSFMNSKLIGIVFPTIAFENIQSLMKIIPCLISILIIFHIRQLFPKYIPLHAVIINSISNSICILLIAFLYNRYPIITYVSFIVVSLYSLLIILITIIQTINYKETGCYTFAFAGFILIITTFIDSSIMTLDSPNGYTLTIGFLIFVFLHAILFLSQTKADKDDELSISLKYDKALSDLHVEETNFLSSHLKPHFLFNALNIISGYAIYDGNKAKNITRALSTYLKQLFEHDNLNEMNSLSNEIDLLKAFGLIEYERFPDIDIQYNINYKSNIPIPSLILQPLLENSVNHGIRKKKNPKGTIKISIIEENNNIFFSIIDDGVGFEDDADIKKAISKPNDNKYHSLYHLQYKLSELYNEKLIIKNFEEEGTYIKFKIPVTTKETQNVAK